MDEAEVGEYLRCLDGTPDPFMNHDAVNGFGKSVEEYELPGFFGPMITAKMAPYPRGAHEEESTH
jgi:hypothetical protein